MTVLGDTNVFIARLRPGSPLVSLCNKHLVGQRLAVAPQTAAEALYGALKAWLGPGSGRLDAPPDPTSAHTPLDIETIEAVARLRNECRAVGHPLHQKQHNGDLWVAATAISWSIPLVAHDKVARGCPMLDLTTEG